MKYLCEGCERLVAPAGFALEGTALVLTCERCGAGTRAQAPGSPAPAAPRDALGAPGRGAAPDGGLPPTAGEGLRAAAAPTSPGEGGVGPQRDERSPAPSAPALRVVSLRPSGEVVRQAAQLARSEDPFAPPAGHCPKCVARRSEEALVCAACGLVYANFRPEEHRPSGPLAEAWVALLAHWDEEARHERFVQLALARGELAAAGRLYRLRLAQAPQDLFAQRGRDEVLRVASASTAAQLALDSQAQQAAPSSRARGLLLGLIVLVALVASVLLFQQLQGMLGGGSPP